MEGKNIKYVELIIFKGLINLFIWEREKERVYVYMVRGGGENSSLLSMEPTWDSSSQHQDRDWSRNLRVGCLTDWATQGPLKLLFLIEFFLKVLIFKA